MSKVAEASLTIKDPLVDRDGIFPPVQFKGCLHSLVIRIGEIPPGYVARQSQTMILLPQIVVN